MKALLFILVVGSCMAAVKKCSNCPTGTSPCDEIVRTRDTKENCACSTCVTKCSVRYNRCPAGQECNLVPSDFNEKVLVAQCAPFTSCPKEECSVSCPVSGFFVDKNGCSLCLCNDPCAELKCPDCITTMTTAYGEPSYECSA